MPFNHIFELVDLIELENSMMELRLSRDFDGLMNQLLCRVYKIE